MYVTNINVINYLSVYSSISDVKKEGLSPVVGILIIIGLVITVSAFATIVVFDSTKQTRTTSQPSINVDYVSESLIEINLIKGSDVIIETALGTEYDLQNPGDTVNIPNQEGNRTPAAYIEDNQQRKLIRQIPPQSFKPDDIVLNDESIQESINSSSSGDIIVVQRGVYNETVEIDKELYIVGEQGSEVKFNGSNTCAINGSSSFAIINMIVDAVGEESTSDYGVCSSSQNESTLVQVKIQNPTSGDTNGPVDAGSISSEVLPDKGSGSNDGITTVSRSEAIAAADVWYKPTADGWVKLKGDSRYQDKFLDPTPSGTVSLDENYFGDVDAVQWSGGNVAGNSLPNETTDRIYDVDSGPEKISTATVFQADSSEGPVAYTFGLKLSDGHSTIGYSQSQSTYDGEFIISYPPGTDSKNIGGDINDKNLIFKTIDRKETTNNISTTVNGSISGSRNISTPDTFPFVRLRVSSPEGVTIHQGPLAVVESGTLPSDVENYFESINIVG